MMKPSPKSQGFIYKIKCNLPSLIKSNSHQSEVTKAEQEKPLTANHSIDRQASPPLPSPLPPFYSLALSKTSAHMQCCVFVSTLHVVIKLNKTKLRIGPKMLARLYPLLKAWFLFSANFATPSKTILITIQQSHTFLKDWCIQICIKPRSCRQQLQPLLISTSLCAFGFRHQIK